MIKAEDQTPLTKSQKQILNWLTKEAVHIADNKGKYSITKFYMTAKGISEKSFLAIAPQLFFHKETNGIVYYRLKN